MKENDSVERLSIYKIEKNLNRTSRGIHERLLENRKQYHEQDYINDINRFIATLQLKNTISIIKKVGIKEKLKQIIKRVRSLKSHGISNTDLIFSIIDIMKYIFRKRVYNLH